MLTSHLTIRRCGWSPEPCWDSPAAVHKHRHVGGQISTAPSPAGGSLGLLQGSCPNLEAGESPGADTALMSGTSGSCSFPTHSSAALLQPGDSQLPRLALTSRPSILYPSACSTEGPRGTGAGPQCRTLCILHRHFFPLNSAKSSMTKVKAAFWGFENIIFSLFVLVRTPLFFQPLSLLAGTESLCPWNVFPTSRFTGTDPSVTLQSLLIEPSLPLPHCGVCVLVVSEHQALRPVEFFFFPEASSANHWMQRDPGKSSFWHHTSCV